MIMSRQLEAAAQPSSSHGGDPAIAEVRIGVVAIGRNEGKRLVSCLNSVANKGNVVVYVDSGSADGSVERAKALGAEVVQLATDKPFTAARARNTGFRRLLEIHPDVHFVQFVDGDCVVAADWPEFAANFLATETAVAIVCGRRRELHPDASLYNRLCDFEWDTPIGDAEACGGDFLARADAFRSVSGFDEHMVAGEEPELCYRLRRAGWRIHRADRPMTYHDAAMTRFAQWTKRMTRAGYAYAARAVLHLGDGDRYCVRENLRIAFWGFLLPFGTLVSSLSVSGWFALAFFADPLQLSRLLWQFDERRKAKGWKRYCFFLLLSKWPEFAGQLIYAVRSLSRREQTIIEYK